MSQERKLLQVLAETISSDLQHSERLIETLRAFENRAPGGLEVYAVATLLHHLYGAIESVLERSVKLFDSVGPSGENWHVRLLEHSAREVPGVRPAILPPNEVVDELRRFRHRFSKRYDSELAPDVLGALVNRVLTGWPEIRRGLTRFQSFVSECIDATD